MATNAQAVSRALRKYAGVITGPAHKAPFWVSGKGRVMVNVDFDVPEIQLRKAEKVANALDNAGYEVDRKSIKDGILWVTKPEPIQHSAIRKALGLKF